MAVAYETSLAPISVTFDAVGETETHAFNAGSGADRVLLVCVAWRDEANTITGVTYNGVAMTELGVKVTESAVFSGHLWRLIAPAAGTNNIAVTMGASGGSQSPGQISAWVGNGADGVEGYDSDLGNGSTANIVSSVTIASATDDRVVVFHLSYNETDNITATATNYVERQDAANGAGMGTEFGDADGSASIATSAEWSNGAYFVRWVALGVNVTAPGGGGGGGDFVLVAN